MTKVITYDTTLRDGEQAEGVSLSLEDKLRITECLDEFGIDIIEGGFAGSNPKDDEYFRTVRDMPLKHAQIAAFGSTRKKGVEAADDAGLAALVACGAPITTIVGKTSALHVDQVLQATREENLAMISESVAFLKAAGKTVMFDAEHFFDGYAYDAEYALACVSAAANAGADCVVLCDTNGGCLPNRIAEAVGKVAIALPNCDLGIHCHNDTGCAVANSIAAVQAGAVQVQGTINGVGERVGNTDLTTVIANLELKCGYLCVGSERLTQLTSVSRFVAETCNRSVPRHHPYSGAAAFAHKGGLHASANARLPLAYEHTDPLLVGNHSNTLVSELAGKASLLLKAESLGLDLSAYPDAIQPILDEIKEREFNGYSFDAADGSLALLIMRALGQRKEFFTLESFRVIVDDYEDTGAQAKDALSEATIKIHIGTDRFVATGEGAGPVGALDNALRMVLAERYPQVADMELTDYKVRILDENTGTGAVTRVLIFTRDALGTFGTIGVSENILEASWNALVDSIEYGLLRANVASC